MAVVRPLPKSRRRDIRGRDRQRRPGGDRDWPTSSAFADLDNDGDLDLYVCHYGVWDAVHPMICKDPSGRINISCDPRSIAPLADHVFRNDGGRFVDVTAQAGIIDRDGRGLGVVAADFDGDGLTDIFVANDSTANFLFQNLGGFRFEEVGHSAGVAANAGGGYQAGMGVACGDSNGDGLIDLAVTNFYGESTTLFHNLGRGLFVDHTAAAHLAAPSRYLLGFGAAFMDADNDGRLDLMTANGHVNDLRPQFPYPMTAQLYRGQPDGRFTDVTSQAGSPFQQLHLGRGLAVGDLDNDGRVDSLMVAQNEALIYFHNRTESAGGHYVTFVLQGTRSNRDGVGAVVTITAGKLRQVGAAVRRRKLPVGRRSPAPLRAGGRGPGRVGRGALAFRSVGAVRKPLGGPMPSPEGRRWLPLTFVHREARVLGTDPCRNEMARGCSARDRQGKARRTSLGALRSAARSILDRRKDETRRRISNWRSDIPKGSRRGCPKNGKLRGLRSCS